MIKIGSLLGGGGPRCFSDKEVELVAGTVTSVWLSVCKPTDEPDEISTYESIMAGMTGDHTGNDDWWSEYVKDTSSWSGGSSHKKEDTGLKFIPVDTS